MSPTRNTAPSADRRLTARSVLASVLLGTDPPWLPTPRLLRTAALFGISEGSARTALSRMSAAGEVVAERGGYRLAGRLVARQARQTASRRAEARPWDGTWELWTVEGDGGRAAADRAALREAMRQLRLAELREGVWGRPDNLDPDRTPEARDLAVVWCRRWSSAVPDPAPDPSALWDLEGWVAAADALRADMARLLPGLEAGDRTGLAEGFVTSAAVLRLLQADPLLPAELEPAGWPGRAVRRDYDRYDAAYRAVLRGWLTTD
ncbi:MAG TPA: PaaX family transcriptional regulator C-terminal domain-containing protein [Acidimicrobiales bacterium]|nr:PaaX family transcriptional regulator C-terminal domain-containing protein [Acidimicrobiales bacterium]